ncbi:MAG: hypothetical protein ABJN40_06025 [Sneathiella sp.]
MCSFNKPKDRSAETARAKEDERKKLVEQGRAAIDGSFKAFDDNYFANVENNYNDFYAPQLDDQYKDAHRTAILRLNTTGGLNSSAGAKKLGDLAELYQKNRALIGDRAISAANTARGDVESNRQALYSQNQAAADPSTIAANSLSRAESLSTAPSYNPLGAVFADFINNVGTGLVAEKNGYNGFGTGLFNNPNSKGSAKVVS